jgi:hypothetical protein
MTEPRDEFLSKEDLDLRNLTDAELIAYWNLWLEQAQAGNDNDRFTYGVKGSRLDIRQLRLA